MRMPILKTLAAAAYSALLLGPTADLWGNEPAGSGFSRICDQPGPPATHPGPPNHYQLPEGVSGNYPATTSPGVGYGSYGSGAHVPHYGYQSGYGCYGSGHCYHNALRNLFPWLACNGHCTYSPDHGWNTPSGLTPPIRRVGVYYQRFWPTAWYGDPQPPGDVPTYPMVYMPTDTTQLGYYYQLVPHWVPNPGMLPPRPPAAVTGGGAYHGQAVAYGADAGLMGDCPIGAHSSHGQPLEIQSPYGAPTYGQPAENGSIYNGPAGSPPVFRQPIYRQAPVPEPQLKQVPPAEQPADPGVPPGPDDFNNSAFNLNGSIDGRTIQPARY